MTPVLFSRVDIDDEIEIERVVRRAVQPVLSTPVFAEDRLPAGQRSWFEGFIRRCAEGALLDSHSDVPSAELDGLWHSFTRDLIERGIIPTVLSALRLANDGDGTEERRGWVSHASDVLHAFLRDSLDLHHLTACAATTRNPAEWARYPAWFGTRRLGQPDTITHLRAVATRWLHVIGGDSAVLRTLLSDDVPEVRFIAAIRLALLYPAATDPEIVEQLREAAADETWIWSLREHFVSFHMGCDEARAVLSALGLETSSRGAGTT